MAASARRVCLENATIVNAFFRLYGRTFNFRNQTYLISYCVYTAATVDLLEMEQFPGAASRAAAERLATTMAMLESEVRQTPGIRRSTDIISSRLKARTSSGELPVHNPVTDSNDPSSSQYIAFGQSEVPSLGVALGNELPGHPAMSFFTQRKGPGEGEAYPNMQNGTPLDLDQPYGSDYSMSINMDEQNSLPWPTYDASGGFNPDIASWTWYDTIGHPESW